MPGKTTRVNFMGGMNNVADQMLHEDRWISFADNVDFRSGSPRPVHGPQFVKASTATARCLFRYRGRWITSDTYRKYCASFVNGKEFIFWSERGANAQKMVEGTQVDIGTLRPLVAPFVASTRDLAPSYVKATDGAKITVVQIPVYIQVFGVRILVGYKPATEVATGNGNLTKGRKSYRIAVETEDGIMPPSYRVDVDLEADGSCVFLEWGYNPLAKNYLIFGRDADKETFITKVPGFTTQWTDLGDVSPYGDLASIYDQNDPVNYFYTYVRTISGVEDESGPSPLTYYTASNLGRRLDFYYKSDGFMSLAGATMLTQGVGGVTLTLDSSSFPTVLLFAADWNPQLQQTEVTTATPHGFVTGDKVQFFGFVDTSWLDQVREVIYLSTTKFAVKELYTPQETISAQTCALYKSVLTITGSASAPVDGDAVDMILTGAYALNSAMYKASVASGTITIPLRVTGTVNPTSIQWVPKNGYYTARRLYRSGGGTDRFRLVAEIPIHQSYFEDAKPASRMGGTPTSYYQVGDIDVIFNPPPKGLLGLELHYGMLFAIDGNNVRWTPTLQFDAWPENFFYNFGSRPLELKSFRDHLVVICEDGLYRIDGNEPTQLTMSSTEAVDGGVATHTAQATPRGLVYLSRRGLMLFNGLTAECFTESKIPANFWNSPGKLKDGTTYPFWWIPSLVSRNYADLAAESGIATPNNDSARWQDTLPLTYLNEGVRSFYHLGKYYLYWPSGDSNFDGNTCIVVDMELQGMPISCLGLKALDVCVDENEVPYALLGNDGSNAVTQTHLQTESPTIASNFEAQLGMVYSAGFVYVAFGSCIYKIDASTGTATVLAGSTTLTGTVDATGSSARFDTLVDLKLGPDGNLYGVQQAGQVRKITMAGVVTTVATVTVGAGLAQGCAVHPSTNDIYVSVSNNNSSIYKVTTAGVVTHVAGTAGQVLTQDGTGTAAFFADPAGMAFDSTGANLYILEWGNSQIRKMTVPGYVVTTVAGASGASSPQGYVDGVGTAVRMHRPCSITRVSDSAFYFVEQGNTYTRTFDPTTNTVATFATNTGGVSGYGSGVATDGTNIFALLSTGAGAANQALYKMTAVIVQPSQSNLTNFYQTQALQGNTTTLNANPQAGIYRLFFSPSRIPFHVRTGRMAFGRPQDRKKFRYIEIHGIGTFFIKIYVDKQLKASGEVRSASENPTKPRKMHVPRGTRGYSMDIEISGDGDLRAIEIASEPMQGAS